MDFCHLWLRCRCIILIRTILVLIRTLFFRILSTPLPFQRSSPSWKKSHRVILQSWWLTEMGPFEPLCSLTHWWPCAGFTANELVKETWVNIPLGLVRTFFCLSQASWKASSHTSSRMYWKTWNSSEIMSLILPILFFSVGKESHSWFPDPLLQEDVRVIEDSQWLLARIHSTSTSDKQPSGKVRVSFSHYFGNYILVHTILLLER